MKTWEDLQHQSALISRGLEEAREILNFNNEVAKIEAWIRAKELLVSQGDLGKDFEHCLELQKKLDDVDSDMKVDESRILKINQMAEKLIAEAGSESGNIEDKKNDIRGKYNQLQELILNYRKQLLISGNIHKFQRDTDETLTRIKEKLLTIDTNEKGKDLKDVQDISKKIEAVTEYMNGVAKRFNDHKTVAATLINNHPDMSESVGTKIEALESLHDAAKNKIKTARSDLAKGEQYHQFVVNCKEFQAWLLDLDKKNKSVMIPNSVGEADAFMTLHRERMAELNGRKETLSKLEAVSKKLLTEDHPESENIKMEIEKTKEIMENIQHSWDDTKQQLQQGNKRRFVNIGCHWSG